MTEKNDYTAKVRGKGLENTGVTEDLAREMYNTLERSTMAIVRLVHKRQINDADTGRTVELVIDLLEPSTSPELDEHLRELTRTLHQNRALKADDQQLQITTADDLEPTVEQVIAAGHQHITETDDTLDLDEDGDATEPAEPADGADPWEYVDPEPAATVPDPIASPFVNAT